MKKLKITVTLILFSFFILEDSFSLSISKKSSIDQKLEKIHLKVDTYSQAKKSFIYHYLIRAINTKMTSENRELIAYIVGNLQESLNNFSITAHNSLILRFSTGTDVLAIIDSQKTKIANVQSVFIFRNGIQNLSGAEIKSITQKLVTINQDILIFIDQEGGLVNRYVDFNTGISNYLSTSYVSQRYNRLGEQEQQLLKDVFPSSVGYFPSLLILGRQYDLFSNDVSKQDFLEIVAYIRLKSLQDVGINTYGLVADLNLGNPAISNSGRSFSQHESKYVKLLDAFIKASEETGIFVYLKHFPGHGAGTIDSHKGILDLTKNSEYLIENMSLFEYFLDNSTMPAGLMVGHIVFDQELVTDFNRVVGKSDFLLTDDLAMQGYKQLQGAEGTSIGFSTNMILNRNNLIKVDTGYVENVY